MSGHLFPASPSSTTSSRPPWNLPGWHVAFLFFCSPPLPPRPLLPSPELLPLCACSLLCLFSRQPGSCSIRGQEPRRSPHLHSIPRMSFLAAPRPARLIGWGVFLGAPEPEPPSQRGAASWLRCPLGGWEQGWSDPGWRGQAYHHSDPHISGPGLGVGALWERLDALRPTLREMW